MEHVQHDEPDRRSLAEAVAAAKTWYVDLAGGKLPAWNYEIRTFNKFLVAIDDYKMRLARVLGYGDDYQVRLRLGTAETTWGRAGL